MSRFPGGVNGHQYGAKAGSPNGASGWPRNGATRLGCLIPTCYQDESYVYYA
jgi:hypothetical protein